MAILINLFESLGEAFDTMLSSVAMDVGRGALRGAKAVGRGTYAAARGANYRAAPGRVRGAAGAAANIAGDVGRAGRGLYRLAAWEPGGAKGAIQLTPRGYRINPVIQQRAILGGAAISVGFGVSNRQVPVEVTGGIPETRRPGDLAATGSLSLALYNSTKG